jgi:hypothetical protein
MNDVHDDGNGPLAGVQRWTCPVCSGPPAFGPTPWTPWFCGNDDCEVLGWDPYATLEENLMNAGPVRYFINGQEKKR